MKTLLQVNVASNFGSTGRIVENIGLLAQSQGWNCYLAHGSRYANPTQLHDISTGTNWEDRAHVIKSLLFDQHGLGSRKATKGLLKAIEQISPDIIHLHNIHGYFLNYPIWFDFLSANKIPVVWTLHDCWPITGHCAYFDFVHCNKWMTHCGECPQLNTYPRAIFKDHSYNNYELKKRYFSAIKDYLHLVPVSDWLKGFYEKSFFAGCPIDRIYNGIDTTLFTVSIQTDSPFIDKKKFNILGVANIWEPRKGYSDFVRLRELLPADFGIIMVGVSSKQLRQLPAGITGIERTDNVKQLAQLYSDADVFFNPTWQDTFPTTNLEALACGTPVITYRTGGSPEAISDDTGFVVEQGDLSAVMTAVRSIQEKGKDFYRLKCRERAVRNFNKDISYQKYIELYDRILNQK